MFFRPVLVWKEVVAFPHLFFDRPRDLAPLVFKVRNVNLDALFERPAFFFFPFSCAPLSAAPTCWDLPRKGLRRILFWPCANRDAYFQGGPDLVVVRVLDDSFFLEARPPPLVPFFRDDSPDTLYFPPFSSFLVFFPYSLDFLAIATVTCWV